jgi:putative nucleotidyltransferase with HDIG domain
LLAMTNASRGSWNRLNQVISTASARPDFVCRSCGKTSVMGIVIIDELVPGMTVAEDIYDRNGRFLLSEGVKLTAKHLRVLKVWGITEVHIAGAKKRDSSASEISELSPELIREASEIVAKRFLRMDMENEVVRELFRLCTIRQAHLTLEKNQGKLADEAQLSTPYSSHRSSHCYPSPNSSDSKLSPFALVRKEIELPALPCIFYQINDVINNPRSSARDIAKVIENDSSLSARLLRLTNSVMYGFRSKIDTISRAVLMIGTKEIGSLALGITIMTHFRDIPGNTLDMKSFWKHNMACAIASRVLAGFRNIANLERLFVGALLHDIGRLILCKYKPNQLSETIRMAQIENKFLYELERQIIGLKHSTIGALLLKEWKLPTSLETIVKYHHQPMRAQDPLEPAIVNVADIITNAAGIGSSGERLVSSLNPEVWNQLRLPPTVFAVILKQVDRQISRLIGIFESGER